MNYIINITEFWFYILTSFFLGAAPLHFYYSNKIAANLSDSDTAPREVELLNAEYEKTASLSEELENRNKQLENELKFKKSILDEVSTLKEQVRKRDSNIEIYKLRHTQIQFEVDTVQKYYKDARIDTSINI
ncbi:hypothetical protein L4D20_04370 [Vibrio kyushuensis]|uniref:hypothetical protein n=1 Tax=Vibrio kyushuensis TaxID=2910249 RepID=UPI003D103615